MLRSSGPDMNRLIAEVGQIANVIIWVITSRANRVCTMENAVVRVRAVIPVWFIVPIPMAAVAGTVANADS